MPRLSVWQSGRKSNDYKFFDRNISEWFNVSGTCVYVHKYLGTHDQRDPQDIAPDAPPAPLTETSIQDVLFLENRDRKYSQNVYELRGVYNVTDADFDLRQFGLFLENDTIFIEFHLNDMLAMVGRKLISGDVLELPHQRDDALLDDGKAINKFYVVEDSNRASDGYSPTWWPHVWRVKCKPMTNSQEYADVLDKPAEDSFGLLMGERVRDLMSNVGLELDLNEAVIEQAKLSVSRRNFETQQFYVVAGEETEGQRPWVFAGDGIPPNGAVLAGSGNQYPQDAEEGAYYLRTDYDPPTLFRRISGVWRRQEIDYRQGDWTAAHRILRDFINNTAIATHDDGTRMDERTYLSKAVRPRADL